MDNQLNEKLIHAIREQLPEGCNPALTLMNTLSLGKEAAYRRLRGDVMFTFEDVAKISKKLGISLDKIVGGSKVQGENQWALVNMNTLFSSCSSKYSEQLVEKLKILLEIFYNMQNQPKAMIRYATTHIPFYFASDHKKLVLFRHYKRAYLTDGINPGFSFSDMKMSSEICKIEKQFFKNCSEIPKHLLILDRSAFCSTIKDIHYFFQRRLISEDERTQLQKELLDILLSMENMTATGKLSAEAEILIYLSDVNLESSFVHLESDTFESSLQLIYFMDVLNFYGPIICQLQKDWIESLKRYSTLITQTGEMQRVEFFNEQRELIQNM